MRRNSFFILFIPLESSIAIDLMLADIRSEVMSRFGPRIKSSTNAPRRISSGLLKATTKINMRIDVNNIFILSLLSREKLRALLP